MNDSQKEKRKTTTITTKISKLFCVLLISVLLVLSSIAVARLTINSTAVYAQTSSPTVTGSCINTTDGQFEVDFAVTNADPNAVYYVRIVEPGGGFIMSEPEDGRADFGYGVVREAPGEYTFYLYEDIDRDFSTADMNFEEEEIVAIESVTVASDGSNCTTRPPPDDGGGGDDDGGGGGGGDDDEEEQPPLTDLFDNQGECIAYADANPDSGITREECNAAFVPGGGCQVTEETDETLEEVCTGGGSFSSGDDPSTHSEGGGGGHGTCTLDKSTDIADCTFSGGGGSGTAHGGSGGRSECTYNNPTGEQDCSFEAGGGGSKPVPDEGGLER